MTPDQAARMVALSEATLHCEHSRLHLPDTVVMLPVGERVNGQYQLEGGLVPVALVRCLDCSAMWMISAKSALEPKASLAIVEGDDDA